MGWLSFEEVADRGHDFPGMFGVAEAELQDGFVDVREFRMLGFVLFPFVVVTRTSSALRRRHSRPL
jgi:hypothetical protein